MKVLILLFVCILAYGDCNSLGGDVEEAFEAKCRNNAPNENAYTEVQDAFRAYFVCQKGTFKSEPPNPVEDHDGFCRYLWNSGLYGCVENLAIGITPCLAETEKYIPHFLLNGLNSTYDELCGADGVANSKILYNKLKDSEICSKRTRGIYWGEMACMAELGIFKNLENRILNLNKSDICYDMDSFQTCMNDLLIRACGEDEDYSPLLDLAFRPFTQECNDLTRD